VTKATGFMGVVRCQTGMVPRGQFCSLCRERAIHMLVELGDFWVLNMAVFLRGS
jgi:hypothetical protein